MECADKGQFGQQGVDSILTSTNCLMVAKVMLSVKGVRAAASQHTVQKSGTVSPSPPHTTHLTSKHLLISIQQGSTFELSTYSSARDGP